MDPINQLAETFRRFPGIGPRQAKRFVYFLLAQNKNFLEEFTKQVKELNASIKQCRDCRRFFNNNHYSSDNDRCRICHDKNRDKSMLLLVEKDIDLDAVEKAGTWRGFYFVLGGTVPILDKDPTSHIRIRELRATVEQKGNILKELVIATSVSTEGENTADYLKEQLADLATKFGFRLSLLGRGLSTGSELEYADPETIKNALKGRC